MELIGAAVTLIAVLGLSVLALIMLSVVVLLCLAGLAMTMARRPQWIRALESRRSAHLRDFGGITRARR